jgi:hypothetical protein
MVENAPSYLYPQFPPPPDEKTPHSNPRYCVQNLLDTQFPFWYFQPTQKGILMKLKNLHLRSDEYRNLLLILEMALEQPEIRFDTISGSTGIETIEKARDFIVGGGRF